MNISCVRSTTYRFTVEHEYGTRTARNTRHSIKMWHDIIASTAAARRSNTSRRNVAPSHRKRHTSAWLHVRQGALMATAPKTQMATPGDQRSGTLESWHWSARQSRGRSPALRALAGWAVPMPTTVWCRWACVYVCAWRVAGRGARARAQCKWITRRARPARVTRAVETRRKGERQESENTGDTNLCLALSVALCGLRRVHGQRLHVLGLGEVKEVARHGGKGDDGRRRGRGLRCGTRLRAR